MIVVYAPNAVLMLTLHAPGGVEVDVAPDQVTSLRNPPTKGDRGSHFPPEANCLVGLADGKAVPVIETCETVRPMMEHR